MKTHQITSIEEVKMSPGTYARAIETAGSDVKVGYEFEFLVQLWGKNFDKAKKDVVKTSSSNPELRTAFLKNYWSNYHINLKKFTNDFSLNPLGKFKNWDEAFEAAAKSELSKVKNLLAEVEQLKKNKKWKAYTKRDPHLRYIPRLMYLGFDPEYYTEWESYGSDQLVPLLKKLNKLIVAHKNYVFDTFPKEIQTWDKKARSLIDANLSYQTLFKMITGLRYERYEHLDVEKLQQFFLPNWNVIIPKTFDGFKYAQYAVQKSLGVLPIVFKQYHQQTKKLDKYYLEPDNSIAGSGTGVELVTPPLPANQALDTLDKVFDMAKKFNFETNASTGLHINVDIPPSFNILKMIVFFGDLRVLEQFGREYNDYARSLEKTLQDPDNRKFAKLTPVKDVQTFTNLKGSVTKFMIKELEKVIADQAKSHHVSVSLENKKYLSLRSVGGEYLQKLPEIKQILGRLLQAIQVASDPQLYREEYLKKLAKIIPTTDVDLKAKLSNLTNRLTGRESELLYARKKLLMLQKLRAIGKIPVIKVIGWSKNVATPNKKIKIWDFPSMGFDTVRIDLQNGTIEDKQTIDNYLDSLKLTKAKKRIQVPKMYSYTLWPYHSPDNWASEKELEEYVSEIRKIIDWQEDDIIRVPIIQYYSLNSPLGQQYFKKILAQIKPYLKKSSSLLEAGALPIYYFAYGMLCDPSLMQGVEFLGAAELRNHELEMLRFANVVPAKNETVQGCLWKLDPRLLKQLDNIEGYPFLYDRKTVPVYLDGKKIAAEIYTMTAETRKDMEGTTPTQDYLRKVMRGYKNAGIPLSQLRAKQPLVQLNELGTTGFEYKKRGSLGNSKYFISKVRFDDKPTEIVVVFEQNNWGVMNIEFAVNSSKTATGGGNQFKIFSHVLHVIRKELAQNIPNNVRFVRISAAPTEDSRVSLYRRGVPYLTDVIQEALGTDWKYLGESKAAYYTWTWGKKNEMA